MKIQAFEISGKAFSEGNVNRKLSQLFNRFQKNVELQFVSYKDRQSIKVRNFILIKSSNENHIRIVNMYLKNIGNIKRIIDRRFVNKILSFTKEKGVKSKWNMKY
ncbi:hypothetical protein CP985_13620 [Malaciobacter mytili LMG 24559]|uniref:Uncharacterized protein n=1 Tax=Malaciobacter mytili LMG 24559 TaxID=1032238 RepID=A0AAX2AE89_9BACT|nr:hypothetical protein [Malaciobacter mytili]AXH16449.1 hypothetical protein AMYT_a0151 [Malaciobacter mytili LMG 24559]RXK12989.1 hypothetical protein CP985_13620 [Malaciobacter mytili LMG 24559]